MNTLKEIEEARKKGIFVLIGYLIIIIFSKYIKQLIALLFALVVIVCALTIEFEIKTKHIEVKKKQLTIKDIQK